MGPRAPAIREDRSSEFGPARPPTRASRAPSPRATHHGDAQVCTGVLEERVPASREPVGCERGHGESDRGGRAGVRGARAEVAGSETPVSFWMIVRVRGTN